MKQREKTQQTKRIISLALYELLLKKPFDEVTVSDICKKAGVSRMTFYRYYTTKEDIFVDFSDERFAEFFDDVVRYQNPTLEEFVLGMFYYISSYRRQLLTLVKAGKEDILLRQLNSYARYLVIGGKLSNIPFNVLNEQVIPFFVGGIFNILLQWISNSEPESPEDITKKTMEILKGRIFVPGYDPHK